MFDEANNIENKVLLYQGKNIPKIDLISSLSKIKDLMVKTCRYFFAGPGVGNTAPFKGFLLYGPPGTGKTELSKQVVRELDETLGNFANIYLLFIDGSVIAAPKWGEAEQRLRAIFSYAEYLEKKKGVTHPKVILLFDDIESLMLGRGAELAKEWHYSINSVFFHGVDNINPTNTLIFATTNKEELVDDAIRDRLYPIKVTPPSIDELMNIANEILEITGVSNTKKEKVLKYIKNKLMEIENPSIRDVKSLTIIKCIEDGVWWG